MLTTYWSISLALSDIVEEQLKLSRRICWVIATLPSLLMTFAGLGVLWSLCVWPGADCDFDSAACGSAYRKASGSRGIPLGEMGRRRDADNDYAGLFFNGCGKCGDDLE